MAQLDNDMIESNGVKQHSFDLNPRQLRDIVEDDEISCLSFHTTNTNLSEEEKPSKQVKWSMTEFLTENASQTRRHGSKRYSRSSDMSASANSLYTVYDDDDEMSTASTQSGYSTYTTDTFFSVDTWQMPKISARQTWLQMFSMLLLVVVVAACGMLRGYMDTITSLQQERVKYVRQPQLASASDVMLDRKVQIKP
eukprot:CAMPEP_0194231470 /NCGR_PEP_ID=MMETSP0158-20130606/205_1 /TAXON_ID=33649 /ORGANISM="Thalassionema nitzschioides, Strain L26-B" /LENGTH=195 /DNA_ID=CAMNT_0038964105 /DNA_START=6 /DNA_END=593 /DNA_ORIENTATION=+